MVRLVLFLILIHYSSYCYAQLTNKTWIIQNDGDALILGDSTFTIEDGMHYNKPQTYLLDNDTITFVEKELFTNINDTDKYREKLHKYYILALACDSMILVRCNETNYLGYEQDTIVLVDYQSLYDPTFSFRHIYFYTSSCYGTCPDFKMEIFSNGLVYFYGSRYTARYTGTWKGQISEQKMNSLLKILRSSNIRHFSNGTGIPIDAPERRMIIKYGDNKLDFCGSNFPYTGRNLLQFFFREYKNFNLKRCTGCRAFIEKGCHKMMMEEYKSIMKEVLSEQGE